MYSAKYTQEEFNAILLNFSAAVKEKQYDKSIPYEAWRKLQSAPTVTIEVFNGGILHASNGTGILYVDKTYDYGFGRFYWNNYMNVKKENDTMTTMPAMNFDFGPCTENVAVSPYGLAVQSKNGHFLTYDAKNNKTIDVTGFTFNFKNMIYKMPAAIKDLRPGAMVLHQGKPMYVTSIEHGIEVVDILASEAKTILPVSNMFGFDYVTTIVSFMNLGNATPSSDNPFGNLMPFMMAQMIFGEDGNTDGMDMGKMLMFSMMTGQQNPLSSLFNSNNT